VSPVEARREKLRERVARGLVWLAAVVWFGFIGLFEVYSYTRPTLLEKTEGRVYEQNNHGHITFLTAQEHFRLELLEFSAPVLFLAGALIDPKRRTWKLREPPM
jgi:hypothetical protein